MVTLITTVEQIMTGLQTTDSEEERFGLIMRAIYGLVMRMLGSHHALSDHASQSAPLSLSDLSSSEGIANNCLTDAS
jgi:hypothetical protein